MEVSKAYVLEYKSQGCWDDGGIGHDLVWYDYKKELKAANDKEALDKSRKFVREPGKECGSFGCINQGLKDFVKLTFVTTRQTSKSRTVTERVVAVADPTKYCSIPGGAFGNR